MKYSKAPIVEAIFDIQIISDSELDPVIFEQLHSHIKEDFPIVKTIYQNQLILNVFAQSSEKTNRVTMGKRFSSKDEKLHIQMKPTGFTFNMQAPYSEWSDFSSKAYYYFGLYKKIVNIVTVQKVSLRYINQITIPFETGLISDYIACGPIIPTGLPKQIANYFSSTLVPYDDGNFVNIVQTIGQSEDKAMPYTLDIEAFQEPKIQIIEKDLKPIFETLREIKNTTFENSLLKSTKQLFD